MNTRNGTLALLCGALLLSSGLALARDHRKSSCGFDNSRPAPVGKHNRPGGQVIIRDDRNRGRYVAPDARFNMATAWNSRRDGWGDPRRPRFASVAPRDDRRCRR